MTLEHQCIDIEGRVFPPVLVENPGISAQANARQAVVLGNHDISRADFVCDHQISAVGAFIYSNGVSARAPDLMGGVTDQHAGYAFGCALCYDDIGYRAGIGINVNLHEITSHSLYHRTLKTQTRGVSYGTL
jgi:hypothetical protein